MSSQPIFYRLRRHRRQSLRYIESFLGLFQRSRQDVLKKMDRPDLLIFQIGIINELLSRRKKTAESSAVFLMVVEG